MIFCKKDIYTNDYINYDMNGNTILRTWTEDWLYLLEKKEDEKKKPSN